MPRKTIQEAEEIARKIMKPPKKDDHANMPHIYNPFPNKVHQADLLFLPNDKGYKYLLVVVDVSSHKCDAEALKSKKPQSVLNAFIKIYSRGILQYPKRIEVDDGTEFKGPIPNFFFESGVAIRRAKPGRHRQQALVERYNQLFGVLLFRKMTAKQLLNRKINTQWITHYKKVRDQINEHAKPTKNITKSPICHGDSCNLLNIGTKVLVALDNPQESTGQKLSGRFRSHDIRFSPEIRVVKEVLIKPNSPPLYLLDGKVGIKKIEPVGYTKNQLYVLSPKEIEFLKKT
jgi:hypothetical protein